MTAPREPHRPPAPPDRLPSPRGGHPSSSDRIRRRTAGGFRAPGRRAARPRPLVRTLAAAALLVLFGGLALPATAQAQADVLVSNIGNTEAGVGHNMTDRYLVAQSFSVPSGGGNYTLTSIEMLIGEDISSTDIGSLGVSVWSADASGHPASSLHTLTNPASIAEDVAASFTAPTGATLEAGNTYVVVAYYDQDLAAGSGPDWRGTRSDDEDATSITGWTLASAGLRRASADTIWSGRTYAFNLRVNGTAEGGTTPPAGICDRTQQVHEVIVSALSGVDDCAAVTDADLASLTGLDMSFQSIASLKSGDFAGLTSLTALALGGNSFTMLPADVFSDLTALTHLPLNDNALESLPADVFSSLTALTVLNLQGNALESLPADVFSGLTALTTLDLDDNALESLPGTVFSSLTSLTTLEVSYNALESLPGTVFSRLTALTRLTLDGNALESLPGTVFSGLTALTTLRLNRNALDSLPGTVFSGLTALTALSLTRNNLNAFPDGLFSGLTALETLSLDGNPTDPLPLTVTVEKVGTNQVRAKVLAGAPFAVDIPVTLGDGTLAGSVTALSVTLGSVDGTAVTVTRTAGTTAAVTVDVDLSTQPTLPFGHTGYAFAKATTGLPATILPDAGASSDAMLSDLVVNDGNANLTLTPTFASDMYTYRASVTNDVAEVTVTAMTTNSGASIEYLDGDDATLDDAGAADGHQVAVAEGDNVIKVKVTAADGNTTETYMVTVNREADTDNNAPSFTSSATFNPAENQTAVGTVEASDSDTGDDITGYALTGYADQALFSIGSTSGVLTFQAAPNYEDAQDANTDNAYLVEVQATSGTGDREQTATQTITVTVQDANEQPDKPAKPTLAAVSGSATSLTATWEKPDLNGGPDITGYNVNYRVSTATAWETFTHSGTGVTRTITGLTASTSYQVRVQALNGETPSAFSDPSDAVTTILDDDLGICTLNPGDLWCGVVTVGTYGPIGYGFVDASTDTGALSDKGFSVETNSYTIDEVWVRSRPNVGDLFFSLTSALTAADQAKLVLHVDDNSGSFAFSTATGPTSPQTYIWESSGLDWSSTSSVTLRLRDTTAPSPTASLDRPSGDHELRQYQKTRRAPADGPQRERARA